MEHDGEQPNSISIAPSIGLIEDPFFTLSENKNLSQLSGRCGISIANY
jgi:hypothetical protein